MALGARVRDPAHGRAARRGIGLEPPERADGTALVAAVRQRRPLLGMGVAPLALELVRGVRRLRRDVRVDLDEDEADAGDEHRRAGEPEPPLRSRQREDDRPKASAR